MQKLVTILFILALFSPSAMADMITLDSPETVSAPSASTIDWEIVKINARGKVLQVRYTWLDADGDTIYLDRPGYRTWTCADRPTPGENAECTALEDPHECCTGEGTGTCDGMDSTCFSDVFGFLVRSQDVGTKIGVGLRTLIWNKMKADVLTGANDGSFSE